MKKPNCFKCKYKQDIIGDCHISCSNLYANVKGDSVGIKGGWFFYPFNFDPTWLVSCDGFLKKD